jgi:hypothetical protein
MHRNATAVYLDFCHILAISACLITLAPGPSCTTDSSAAMTATAPVRSLVHVWPCSTPLQSSLRLPFEIPSHSPPCQFLCKSHISSLACLPHLPLPPNIPICFLTTVCQFWPICCLDTEFECLPFLRLPFWRYRWSRLVLYFPKSPKTVQSDMFDLLDACLSCKLWKLKRVPSTESNPYPHTNRLTLAHFGQPCGFATSKCFITM